MTQPWAWAVVARAESAVAAKAMLEAAAQPVVGVAMDQRVRAD
jgi:hypothetical protein